MEINMEIEVEKLQIIAEYYKFPMAVFMTKLEDLKRVKPHDTRLEYLLKEVRKLDRIREILKEDEL